MRENNSVIGRLNLSVKKLCRIGWVAAFFLLIGMNASAQQSPVRGKIADSQTGEPMAGVNIVVQGTSTGTISEADGSYTIQADKNSNLVFSFIGYVTQVLPVSSRSTVDVALVSEVKGLNEVVVVGYGTVKKATS